MAHTFTRLYYHLVFSTKNRRAYIDEIIELRLHNYIRGIVDKLDGLVITIGGMPDHIHILAMLRPTVAISDVLNKIKANSSGWVHDEWLDRRDFAWQTGYAAFTVSRSNLEDVARYIDNQKDHHRKTTFEEEFLALLQRHDVDYDPRFVFD